MKVAGLPGAVGIMRGFRTPGACAPLEFIRLGGGRKQELPGLQWLQVHFCNEKSSNTQFSTWAPPGHQHVPPLLGHGRLPIPSCPIVRHQPQPPLQSPLNSYAKPPRTCPTLPHNLFGFFQFHLPLHPTSTCPQLDLCGCRWLQNTGLEELARWGRDCRAEKGREESASMGVCVCVW